MAEYQEENFQLRQQVEQLTVLKPHVLLLRADTNFEEVSASHQQPKEPKVEQNEARDPQQVKEEQVDICITSNQNDCPSEDVNVMLGGPEANSQTGGQIFSTGDAITMTLSHDGEWIEGDDGDGWRRDKNLKECRFCRKKFFKYSDLVRHVEKVHVGKKPFKCSQCDREFTRQDRLALHSRLHTGVKPYTCTFCKKCFSQTSQLNAHLRIHTGEKPYFCKSCGKMVANSKHIKTCAMMSAKASEGKQFRCSVCGKKFYTASDLNVHIAVHDARKAHSVE